MPVSGKHRFARSLLADRRGATAIEYGLICSLIFLALLAAAQEVSRQNTATYDLIEESIVNANAEAD